MGREELWKLLEELNDRLADQDVHAELYIIGGSAMALGYDEDRTTMDVDCRIGESAHEVHEAAQAIAQEHGLAKDWLNEAAEQTFMIPEEPDTAQRTVFAEPDLIVTIASPERMIAMKTAAGRSIDLKDGAVPVPVQREEIGALRGDRVYRALERRRRLASRLDHVEDVPRQPHVGALELAAQDLRS